MKSVAAAAMALLLLVLLNAMLSVSAASRHAASQFKAPNPQTPSDQADAWREEDEALHAYIKASVPKVLEHTGADAFDEHLHGVQAILRFWGSEKHLYNAGLFHSICETKQWGSSWWNGSHTTLFLDLWHI